VNVENEGSQNTNIEILGCPVGGVAVQRGDDAAAFLEMLEDVAALEFHDNGLTGCVHAFEDEGNHSTVDDTSINLDPIGLLYLVEGLVIDFGFGVTGVGCIMLKFGAKIGAYFHRIGMCEGLKDFREENVFVAEELEGGFVKCGGTAVPEILV